MIRHANRLRPSADDDFRLAEAVEQRFLDLCGAWLRVKGVELIPPKSLNREMFLWRTMRVRYRSGDCRHTEAELRATKAIAQWTLDCQCELRNQPKQILKWKD
jgi:hypothetical protein